MKRKKKFNKLIFLGVLFMFYFYIKNNLFVTDDSPVMPMSTNSSSSSEYTILKEDSNSNYSGLGQQKVTGKDGYFTTFTTTDNNKKTYKEFKQNGNSSWSNKDYWGGTMSENGCGITSIAIILSGYGKDYTPDTLRKKYYPVLNAEKISSELLKKYKIRN